MALVRYQASVFRLQGHCYELDATSPCSDSFKTSFNRPNALRKTLALKQPRRTATEHVCPEKRYFGADLFFDIAIFRATRAMHPPAVGVGASGGLERHGRQTSESKAHGEGRTDVAAR